MRHPKYKGIEIWWLRQAFNHTNILPHLHTSRRAFVCVCVDSGIHTSLAYIYAPLAYVYALHTPTMLSTRLLCSPHAYYALRWPTMLSAGLTPCPHT